MFLAWSQRGSTPEEIQRNVQEALEVLFEAWEELGKKPPPALKEATPMDSAEILVAV